MGGGKINAFKIVGVKECALYKHIIAGIYFAVSVYVALYHNGGYGSFGSVNGGDYSCTGGDKLVFFYFLTVFIYNAEIAREVCYKIRTLGFGIYAG